MQLSSRLLLGALALLSAAPSVKAQTMILTSDQQLTTLANDPDKKFDNSLGYNKSYQCLRDIVNEAKERNRDYITIAFDEFFRQYRTDTNVERKLTPDMDEYVEKMAKISNFAKKEGKGLELSLLSPLELGQAYKHQTGHSGRWVAFKVGRRNPANGKFSIQMWQQTQWTNNKGETPVKLIGVKAFAFKADKVTKRKYAVNPDEIVELKNVKWENIDESGPAEDGNIPQKRLRIYGEENACAGYNNVLVLLEYETQEMDYFADDAAPFLNGLLKKYHDYGINLKALYSDEMHIQQDWIYYKHQEDGQFNERYLTESMIKKFSEKFKMPFAEKYMLYFLSQPLISNPTTESILNVEYVLGKTPEDIQRTYLMRDNYYRMLNNDVVDLFNNAKKYGEKLFKQELRASAHSSWAESPTIDLWDCDENTPGNGYAFNYEYTPNFLWSNTVQQASAACYDYFKWGEYLEPTGNDFCECGWLDRNYYGAAMAASIGVINKYPNAYAAAWGMPWSSNERRMAVNYAFGCQPPQNVKMITDNVIRDVDVLMLYPMNLVAVDQRFGSWMTQYGYANYLTSDKLLQLGSITADGHMKVAAKQYGTIVVMFEPMPNSGLLDMLTKFANAGGKVVWFSAPPMLDKSGANCTAQWESLFGVNYKHTVFNGLQVPGQCIKFGGKLKNVPEQIILTDKLVDHIYPIEANGADIVASCGKFNIGAIKTYPNGGLAMYCGFRARDDQSQSLGYESRTMFELLNAINAYPATGKFQGVNDNPSYVSRTTPYFATSFPNGGTMIARHYRTHMENWPGGFSRDQKADDKALSENPLPTDSLTIKDMKVNGHTLTFDGRLTMGFNVTGGTLSAFTGQRCDKVEIDGKTYKFADGTLANIAFGPVNGNLKHYQLVAAGQPKVNIPVTAKKAEVKCGKTAVPATVANGTLTIDLGKDFQNKTIDIKLK
ncbi:MAG: hypothetical protein SOU27_05100 [Sodaliphilus sp.]|nr:hypothetical protein [Sodaliphilus sp.]